MFYKFNPSDITEVGSEDSIKCGELMRKIFHSNGIMDEETIVTSSITLTLIHYLFNLDLDNILKYTFTEYGLSFFNEYIKVEADMNIEAVTLNTEHTISKRFRR